MNNTDFAHIVSELSKHLAIGHRAWINGVNTKSHRQMPPLSAGVYGLYFRLEIRAWNGGYEKDGQTKHPEWERDYWHTLHIIVSERHQVFVVSTDHMKSSEVPPAIAWRNTSNHDSCWYSDGFGLRDELDAAYQTCWSHVPDEHRTPQIAAHITCQFENWCFGAPPFQVVKIKAVSDPNDSYRKILTEITPLTYHLNIIDPEAP